MDVKKLIVGFLILATAAGSSAFIISLAGNAGTSQSAVAVTANTGATSVGNSTGSGFVGSNQLLDPSAITLYASTSTATSSDPNNLTDQLANAYLNNVIAANPAGLTTDAGGNKTLTPPNNQTVVDDLAGLPIMKGFKIPNWDLEAASQPIKITTSSAPKDIQQYGTALNDIIQKNLIQTNVVSTITSNTADSAQAVYIESQIQTTLRDVASLETPAPLADFERSFVKSMVYEKNILALTQDGATDPVKAEVILQNEEGKYNAAIQDFETQIEKVNALGFSFGAGDAGNQSVAFVNNIFGIPTTHALFGVGDFSITWNPTLFAQGLEKFAKDILLQITKNAIIATMQRKVLTALQGNGAAPQFIKNWSETIANSYEQSALAALDSQMSCINPAFAPQIRATIGAFYKPNNNLSCADSFQAALGANSVQQFYNNFEDGGFLAYGASMLPSGNYYGGLYATAQVVNNSAQVGQQATQDKNVSSGGLTGAAYCTDGSNPNGTHLECKVSDGTIDIPNGDGTSCPTGDTPVNVQNNGRCADGSEPTVSTPGIITGFSVQAAVNSGPALITAANSITGLVAAAESSLLSTLAQEAISSATGAINAGLSGGGGSSGGVLSVNPNNIQGGGTPPKPIPLSCSPSAQNASTSAAVFLAATGGTFDSTGNSPDYFWHSSDNQTSTGEVFNPVYNIPGTYTITLSDSAKDATSTCTINVQ